MMWKWKFRKFKAMYLPHLANDVMTLQLQQFCKTIKHLSFSCPRPTQH